MERNGLLSPVQECLLSQVAKASVVVMGVKCWLSPVQTIYLLWTMQKLFIVIDLLETLGYVWRQPSAF